MPLRQLLDPVAALEPARPDRTQEAAGLERAHRVLHVVDQERIAGRNDNADRLDGERRAGPHQSGRAGAHRPGGHPRRPPDAQPHRFTKVDLGVNAGGGYDPTVIFSGRSTFTFRGRLAWHAWTTKGIGPGITYGEKTTALVREAVADVLAAFPPH